MRVSPKSSAWKWRALAVVPIVLLSLAPQIQFWVDRGSRWHGAYATLNADEFLYSGYVNSLVNGRPRRNDPFTGAVDQPDSPMPETAFSIQVVPAFSVAFLAKILRITSSTAFIALTIGGAFLASLALFWLISSITSDEKIAAAGVLFVLLAGTVAGGQGLIGVLLKLDTVSLGLPFLRRYQPVASFYLFFLFSVLLWHGLTCTDKRRARLSSVLAGFALVVLVFSYLYLWTAALALLGCIALLWFVFQSRDQHQRGVEVFAIIFALFAVSLVPYGYLISHRSHTLDELQSLTLTHRPDLFQIPELIGGGVLLVLVILSLRRQIRKDDPRCLFAAAFALLPLVVLNQQVVSGRSMQPFHFTAFVVNYAALVSIVISAKLLWQVSTRNLLFISFLFCLLGAAEVELTRAFAPIDNAKDEMIPALARLKQFSNKLDIVANDAGLVFSPHFEVMQMLPTWAPQGTLLGIGAIDFGSASHQERKERLYTHLYYSGATTDRFRNLLRGAPQELQFSYYVRYVIFGHERVRPSFTLNFQPITEGEIESETNTYANFIKSFSRAEVMKHPLSYGVISSNKNIDLSNLDRWYERDAGENLDSYTIYQLRPRN